MNALRRTLRGFEIESTIEGVQETGEPRQAAMGRSDGVTAGFNSIEYVAL